MKSTLLVGPFFSDFHRESAYQLLFKMYAESQRKVAENQRFFYYYYFLTVSWIFPCLVIVFLQAFPS